MVLLAGLPLFESLAVSSAAGGSSPATLAVTCEATGKQQHTTVTAANTTLQVTCPGGYTLEPAAEKQEVCGDAQCKDVKALTFFCPNATAKSLLQHRDPGLALTIPTLPGAPKTFYLQCKAPPDGAPGKDCVVQVSVKSAAAGAERRVLLQESTGQKPTREARADKADEAGAQASKGPKGEPQGPAGPAGDGPSGKDNESHKDNQVPPVSDTDHHNADTDTQQGQAGPEGQVGPEEESNQQGGAAGPGGIADVQTCETPKTSLTIRLPEQGSLAKFACQSGFTLYPSLSNKVFSKDCKKQETLKDMTRTQTQTSTPTSPPPATAGPGTPGGKKVTLADASTSTTTPSHPPAEQKPAATPTVIYTLKAEKKPPRKTLCYLCAKEGVSEQKPGAAGDYCTIYVESRACRQYGLGLTFALMLPCLVGLLHFT